MSPISSGVRRPRRAARASTSMSLELDGRRRVVAEHGRGGRVADEHQVDTRRLGGAGGRVVVGGDHHDRFAEALLLRQQRQGHRQAAGVGWGVDGGVWLDMV